MCDYVCFFFFNDTATTEIYTLSLHDALPICGERRRGASERARPRGPSARVRGSGAAARAGEPPAPGRCARDHRRLDRKSTRLNSSHANISYAVFCLKKKKKQSTTHQVQQQNQ